MREGKESTRHPSMGVYALCLGPNSPLPGERLELVIYDHNDRVIRRLEQTSVCVVEPYVTFFANDPRARPGVWRHPLIDIDPASGAETELHPDYQQSMGMQPYFDVLAAWVARYGVPDA